MKQWHVHSAHFPHLHLSQASALPFDKQRLRNVQPPYARDKTRGNRNSILHTACSLFFLFLSSPSPSSLDLSRQTSKGSQLGVYPVNRRSWRLFSLSGCFVTPLSCFLYCGRLGSLLFSLHHQIKFGQKYHLFNFFCLSLSHLENCTSFRHWNHHWKSRGEPQILWELLNEVNFEIQNSPACRAAQS